MHTVELLDELLAQLKECGVLVRQEWLNGSAGGYCEIGGRGCLFLDLSASAPEQFELAKAAAAQVPQLETLALSAELRRKLQVKRSA